MVIYRSQLQHLEKFTSPLDLQLVQHFSIIYSIFGLTTVPHMPHNQ